jgi:outer membrane protein assembly factor BamB
MKRRYYNPFLERTRARAAEGQSHAEDGGPTNLEAEAAAGEAGTSAPLRAPLPPNWYLLPPGMSVTMALARLPLATRRVVRRVSPAHVIVACAVALTLALGVIQVGLLQPVLPPLLGPGAPEPLPAGNDWTQYRYDEFGTGFNPEGSLFSGNVARLTRRWVISGYAAFEATPAVADGVIYTTNGNSLYAFDLRTGKALWHHDGIPQRIGTINSSVAVDPTAHLAYYGTPDARVYAVDIRTGKRAWVTQLSTAPGAFVWSSPLLVNGKVYVGLASHDDNPCVRGAVFALDASVGTIRWVHYTAAQGELGGGVWSSLAADPDHHEVIATTGNPCPDGPSDVQQDSIIGIDWNTGATTWQYTAIPIDQCDCDFGQGPVAFTYQGRGYVVAGNKFGAVYGLRRSAAGDARLAWSVRITGSGFVGRGGIFEPPTYGGGLVYISGGPTLDGRCAQGAVWAFRPDSGEVAWRACTKGQVISPAALVRDTLFVAQQGVLVIYEASTGHTLANLPYDGSVWGGVAVAHGYVLVGTVSGKLYCYTVPGLK